MMRKFSFFFTIFLSLTIFTGTAYAGKGELFKVDESKLDAEFEQLNKLDQFVDANQDITWNELQDNHNDWLMQHPMNTLDVSGSLGSGFTLDDMDWGAFAWGFCCCPVGFFVVALNSDKDGYQKTSFWIGVAAGFLVSSISSVVNSLGAVSVQ